MTIQQARNILGESIKHLTDDEISYLIYEVGTICDEIINIVVKDNSLDTNTD